MWKNGKTPTSTSSPEIRCTERICSMLATRLRCVSITPFDSPVVPLENGSAATSPAGSIAGAPGSASAVGSDSSVNTLIPAFATAARSGSAAITALASALRSCLAISSGVSSGLIDVTIAPSATTAWNATGHAGLFGPSRPTASPGPIPSAASPAAAARIRCASSAYVVTAPLAPSIKAGLSPRCSAPPSTYSVSETSGTCTSGYGLRRTIRAAYVRPRRLATLGRRRRRRADVARLGRRLAGLVERAERLQLDADDDVAHRQGEILVPLGRPLAAGPGELRVGDRQEVGVVRVEEVRHP